MLIGGWIEGACTIDTHQTPGMSTWEEMQKRLLKTDCVLFFFMQQELLTSHSPDPTSLTGDRNPERT